jgi:hypothetical protein
VSKVEAAGLARRPAWLGARVTAYCEENHGRRRRGLIVFCGPKRMYPFVLQQETDMSTKKTDQSPRLESKPDLIPEIEGIKTELTEHELLHVTGGRLDGIKGESQDDKHKDPWLLWPR